MSPFSSKTIPATIILIGLFFLNMLIPESKNVFLDIFLRSSVISILFILTTYFLNISPDAKQLIDNYLKINFMEKASISWDDFEKLTSE